MIAGTTLTERARFVSPFVHKMLCDSGTFSKFLVDPFPVREGYKFFEPPLHGDPSYMVVIGP